MNRRFSLFDSVRETSALAPARTAEESLPEETRQEIAGPSVPETEINGLNLALASNKDASWAVDLTGAPLVMNDAFMALDQRSAKGLQLLSGERIGSDGDELFDLADGDGTLRLVWRSDGKLTVFSAVFDWEKPAASAPPVSAPALQGGGLSAGGQFDALGLGWAMFDLTTSLADCNRTFRQMFSLEDEFVARRPRYFKLLDHFRATRQIEEQVDFRAFRDRELGLFEAASVPDDNNFYLPDGRVLRRLVVDGGEGARCFLYDDQTAQLALKTSLNAVAAVQQTTLDNLFEGAVLFGGNGRVQLTNARLRELWPGFDSSAAGSDLPPHLDDFLASLQSEMPAGGDSEPLRQLLLTCLSERREGRLRLAFGNDRSFDALAVPLPDGAILLSLLDVTSDVRMQAALEDRAEAFAAADRLKSEFIANVSHEVRTPLTALQGFAEVLKDGMFGKLQGRQLDYADAIVRSSRELTSLVDDILDLAVVEAGQAGLDIARVDIHALVVGVMNRTRALAERRRVSLSFDVVPDIGWLAVDERRMQQALYNLVCNALALTPQGGRVSITAWRDEAANGEMVISVGDTGTGLQGRDPEELFGRFTGPRDGAGDSPATGLGMTIVRKFVELHGGTVTVRDRERQGLMVECRLPA